MIQTSRIPLLVLWRGNNVATDERNEQTASHLVESFLTTTIINFCPNILTTSTHKITGSAAKQQTQASSTKHNGAQIPTQVFMYVCV